MKCPHCGQEHPANTKFCPETGMKMELQYWVCRKEGCSFRQPLPPTAKFCPNCGTPRDFSTQDNHNQKKSSTYDAPHGQGLIFPVFDIVLGQTTITELWSSGKYFGIGVDHSDGSSIHLTSSIVALALYDQAPIHGIYSEDYNDDIDIWSRILPLQRDMSIKRIAKYCKKNQISYLIKDEMIIMILEDGRHILKIDEDNAIYLLKGEPCPNCGSTHFKIGSESCRSCLELQCKSCNKTYDQFEILSERMSLCPKCGSKDVENDQSDYLQFKCNMCDHVWGNDIDEEPEDDDDEENDEEIICPECGSDDCEDDGSGYMQYECNDCGHVWGCELESEDDSDHEDDDDDEVDDENDDELHKFFPVHGITLGETTVDDLEYDIPEDLDIEYKDDGDVIVWTITPNGYHGAQIHSMPYEDELSMLYVTHYENMFIEWEELGFDWELSYNDWLKLFRSRGYAVDIIEYPKQEYFEKRGYWYLSARFRASAPDNTLFFELDFSYGEYGTKQTSKGTLYSITATTDISHFDE